MNVNVGCGAYRAAGWLNIDAYAPGADLAWDCTTGLPPTDERIARIYAGHVLEHLAADAVPDVLAAWRAHPQVGAHTVLAVVGPDCDTGRRWVADGRMTEAQYAELDVTPPGRVEEHEGGPHLWRCTEAGAAGLLRAGGWDSSPAALSVLAAGGWPLTSLIGWQFALIATPRED